MKFLFLSLITFYQWCLRPLLGVGHCRFYPSCSEYAKEAVQQHGAWRGVWLAVRRVGCCHPYHPGGYDPVPDDGRHPHRCKHRHADKEAPEAGEESAGAKQNFSNTATAGCSQ